jgi:hypothetical protein
VAALETSTLPTHWSSTWVKIRPSGRRISVSMPRFQQGWLPQFTPMANVLGNPPWGARMWLRRNLVRMPSKNFLAIHQLDIHLCTEFPYTSTGRITTLAWCTDNGRILLANLLRRSRSTFSWGSFLSLCAFKVGMMDAQISALGGWPTVSARFLDSARRAQSRWTRCIPTTKAGWSQQRYAKFHRACGVVVER